jgi:hypothetical protein
MNFKIIIMVLAMGSIFSSCVVAHTAQVTNNPVGSKVGVASGGLMKKDLDFSFQKAKENGNISKVGIAEFKMTQILIFPKVKTTVTGE